jgi:hypothetical protein
MVDCGWMGVLEIVSWQLVQASIIFLVFCPLVPSTVTGDGEISNYGLESSSSPFGSVSFCFMYFCKALLLGL